MIPLYVWPALADLGRRSLAMPGHIDTESALTVRLDRDGALIDWTVEPIATRVHNPGPHSCGFVAKAEWFTGVRLGVDDDGVRQVQYLDRLRALIAGVTISEVARDRPRYEPQSAGMCAPAWAVYQWIAGGGCNFLPTGLKPATLATEEQRAALLAEILHGPSGSLPAGADDVDTYDPKDEISRAVYAHAARTLGEGCIPVPIKAAGKIRVLVDDEEWWLTDPVRDYYLREVSGATAGTGHCSVCAEVRPIIRKHPQVDAGLQQIGALLSAPREDNGFAFWTRAYGHVAPICTTCALEIAEGLSQLPDRSWILGKDKAGSATSYALWAADGTPVMPIVRDILDPMIEGKVTTEVRRTLEAAKRKEAVERLAGVEGSIYYTAMSRTKIRYGLLYTDNTTVAALLDRCQRWQAAGLPSPRTIARMGTLWSNQEAYYDPKRGMGHRKTREKSVEAGLIASTEVSDILMPTTYRRAILHHVFVGAPLDAGVRSVLGRAYPEALKLYLNLENLMETETPDETPDETGADLFGDDPTPPDDKKPKDAKSTAGPEAMRRRRQIACAVHPQEDALPTWQAKWFFNLGRLRTLYAEQLRRGKKDVPVVGAERSGLDHLMRAPGAAVTSLVARSGPTYDQIRTEYKDVPPEMLIILERMQQIRPLTLDLLGAANGDTLPSTVSEADRRMVAAGIAHQIAAIKQSWAEVPNHALTAK